MARCLVLTGGAIAAWMLGSGIASATESAEVPLSALAAEPLLAELPLPGGSLPGGSLLSSEPLPAEPLGPVAEAPVELAGVIGNPAGPGQLPGLDGLPSLTGLPALHEPPLQGEYPSRPPAQKPELRPPAAGPTTSTQPMGRTAQARDGQVGGSAAEGRAVSQRPGTVEPTRLPWLPTGEPGTDWPCPASPGQPGSVQAAGSPCPAEPASIAGDTTPDELLRPAPHGPAEPRLIAERPGTTPD